MRNKIIFIIPFFLLFYPIFLYSGTYSGGGGTSGNPYLISSASDVVELMNTNTDWIAGKFFVVTQNINCSQISATPIGTPTDEFAADFDGQNFKISNIAMNLPSNDYIGFFGYSIGASIRNLGIVDCDIIGSQFVGGFIGGGRSSIVNCYSTGSVEGRSNVGGFCGLNTGYISGCYSKCNITANNNKSSYIGGFCGSNWATIKNCYANGDVSVPYTTRYDIGAFCGANLGSIINSYSNGNVESYGNNIGGFCGNNSNIISKCYSTGDATSSGDNCYSVGGFCGRNASNISNCFSLGNATAPGNTSKYIGGFCGRNQGNINYCYSMGEPSGNSYVGGFIGYFSSGNSLCNFWGFPSANLYDVGGSSTGSDYPDNQIKELTVAEFAYQSSFPCFDFVNVWALSRDKPTLIPTLTQWASIAFISLLSLIGVFYIFKKFI